MAYRLDYHIHSFFSPDSKCPPEDSVKRAAEIGLDEIMFTDHCECNFSDKAMPPSEPPQKQIDIPSYTEYLEKIKKSAPIKVGVGIELGQATQNPEYADMVLNAYDWDMVIGSYHNLKDEYDFYFLNYADFDLNKLSEQYFKELYEMVALNQFDVLGHLYYFVRYVYRQGLSVNLSKHNGYMEDIFKLLVKNGKGIEINTSCIHDKYGQTIPNLEYLKLYKKCGGEIITIGSDAHIAKNIGRGEKLSKKLLKQAGFNAITSYEKRKPVFKDL